MISPSSTPATTNAPWRLFISKTGSRAGTTEPRRTETAGVALKSVGCAKPAPMLAERADRRVDLSHHDRDPIAHIARTNWIAGDRFPQSQRICCRIGRLA